MVSNQQHVPNLGFAPTVRKVSEQEFAFLVAQDEERSRLHNARTQYELQRLDEKQFRRLVRWMVWLYS